MKRIFTLTLVLIIQTFTSINAQTTTIPSGSFIVDMGVIPQTVGNGLKPYGLVYSLITNFKIPIKWVIEPGKVYNDADLTYNGKDYKGGPFIVFAEYRSQGVNDTIARYQTQGVVGLTTTAPFDVPFAYTLQFSTVPRWTLDLLNGSVAIPYFINAGIPASAYNAPKTNPKLPSALGSCDDIFVMPHAYPQWSTHSNLYFWNLTYKGSIYTSCTAGSELEDMFNPADHTQQTNFLSEKDPTIPFPTGTVSTVENALILYNHHTNGGPPYTYTNWDYQFMQLIGNVDAATQNGLEQVYIPKSGGWRPTTSVGIYDPDHTQRYQLSDDPKYRAAIIAFGRAFGDPNRGYVMIEAAHSLNSSSNIPANVAAQRAFFNFSFIAGKGSTVALNLSTIPTTIPSGTPTPVSFSFPVGVNSSIYTITWSAICGGTFTEDPAFPNDLMHRIFTPPAVINNTPCAITISTKDPCDKVSNTIQSITITTDLQVVTSLTNACYGIANGSIGMTFSGAAGPYNWTWTKAGGGSGSGAGVSITGLAAGTYTVAVTAGGGAGSSKTFTVTLAENPAINALTAAPTNILCNGLTSGAIALTSASGGTAPFTYLWSDANTAQNRNNLAPGTYSVTATDAKGCSVSSSNIIITQPNAISISPAITNILCNGNTTGAISLTVTGGTGAITYAWNDGATTKNRTGMGSGTYSVTATDANNCSLTSSGISITQPAAPLSLSASTINALCNGASTGSITLTPSGGTTPYTYNWGGGITSQNRATIPAGNYSVTVTDANNCSTVLSKTITQPTAILISTALTPETCPNSADGSITATIIGGSGSYTYAWTGPNAFTANTKDISSKKGGSYTLVVTDSAGCQATLTVVLPTTNSNAVAPATINH